MKRILLFSSSRNSSSTAAGLRLLHELSKPADRDNLIVVLMQDAVLLALKDYGSDFQNISEAYVLDEHLAKRGFAAQSLRPPFKSTGYDGIVELIMKDETRAIGSF